MKRTKTASRRLLENGRGRINETCIPSASGRTINLVDLVMLSNGRDMGSWMDLAAPG